jgi:hypothetical protein
MAIPVYELQQSLSPEPGGMHHVDQVADTHSRTQGAERINQISVHRLDTQLVVQGPSSVGRKMRRGAPLPFSAPTRRITLT